MEQVQQELIRSNEFLAQQVWILGGLIIGLLALLGFFARSAWVDMRTMLSDHEERLRAVEDHKIEMKGLVDRHEEDIREHKVLMGRLSDNVNRLSKI
jgi:hypothetical protein